MPHEASWRSWLARRPVTAEVAGSSPVEVAEASRPGHHGRADSIQGSVAQLVERSTENRKVTGSTPVGATAKGPDPTRIRAFVVPGRGGRGPLWWVSGWRRLRPSTVGSGVAGTGIDCPGPEATKMRRRAGALVRGLGDWYVLWRIRRPLGVAEGHVLMAWARTHRGRCVRAGYQEAVALRWPACCDRHPRPRGCQPAGGRAEADRREQWGYTIKECTLPDMICFQPGRGSHKEPGLRFACGSPGRLVS